MTITGSTDDRGFEQLALRSPEATLGFSGAPIWSQDASAVVGMFEGIVTRSRRPGSRGGVRRARGGYQVAVPRSCPGHGQSRAEAPEARWSRLQGHRNGAGHGQQRFCFISSEYPPRMVGGLGSHVEQLSTAISRQIGVDIVLPDHRSDYEPPSTSKVQLHSLSGGSPSYALPASWIGFCDAAAARIGTLVERGNRISVVHCHDWVTVLAGLRCRWRYQLPLVFHIHLPNREPLSALIENLGLACADVDTVNSESMREELRKRCQALGIDSPPMRVINNGVDFGMFKPRDDWRADDGYVLFVGLLVAQKGVDYLLRAFYYVSNRFPDLRLKIVGDGDLAPHLRRLCTNLMIPPEKVEFVTPAGWVSREEMAALYQGAMAVVVPSIYEPFGMTAVEALACQRPVVASRIGGLKETVRHNVNGMLAEPRDEPDIAQWLMTLAANADLRARLGLEGRRSIGPEYSWHVIGQQFVELYGELKPTDDAEIPAVAIKFRNQIKKIASGMPSVNSSALNDLFDWRKPARRRRRFSNWRVRESRHGTSRRCCGVSSTRPSKSSTTSWTARARRRRARSGTCSCS